MTIRRILFFGGLLSSLGALGAVWSQAPVQPDGSRDLSAGIRATALELSRTISQSPGGLEPTMFGTGAGGAASSPVSASQETASIGQQYRSVMEVLGEEGAGRNGNAAATRWSGPGAGNSSGAWSGPGARRPEAGAGAAASAGMAFGNAGPSSVTAGSSSGWLGSGGGAGNDSGGSALLKRLTAYIGLGRESAATGPVQTGEEIERVLKEAERKEKRAKNGESAVLIYGQGADLELMSDDPSAPRR